MELPKRLFSDPLLHFLMIGAALFLFFEFFGTSSENTDNLIRISQSDIAALEANFNRTWTRPPTDEELQNLIDSQVRDEVAFQEAVAMGLDKNDPYIRGRLRMKLELLFDDIAELTSPTEDDLQEYLEKNRQAYIAEPQFSFKQVYVRVDGNTAIAQDAARNILAELTTAGPEANPSQYGDQIMLPAELPLSSLSAIKLKFGNTFAEQLQQAEPGKWIGPVDSEFGLHLVFIRQFTPERKLKLAEVRKEVERDWAAQHRIQVREEAYRKLLENYTLVIEPKQDISQKSQQKNQQPDKGSGNAQEG